MGKNETAPKTGMVLQVEAIDIFLIFSYCFPRVLHLAWVTVTIGSMRRYLDPTEVTQAVQLLRDGPSICAVGCVSQHSLKSMEEIPGDTVTLEELDRAVEAPKPISRTGICSVMQEGTG